ncbi:LysR family transcriptional regulator [Limosilactobacillus fermentum]|uniref:LysR family transcriptional regulator n=2 Tax=Limosilactobacillus fermentum TaxID=1613 RepID=UPI003BA07E39
MEANQFYGYDKQKRRYLGGLKMNIKELRYYHDLVIQKNFSKVATHFGVAQPTITMAIQRLERELGEPLFIRSQSHHDLTVTAAVCSLTSTSKPSCVNWRSLTKSFPGPNRNEFALAYRRSSVTTFSPPTPPPC